MHLIAEIDWVTLGTWVGAIAAVIAIVVAIYFGIRQTSGSLRQQQRSGKNSRNIQGGRDIYLCNDSGSED